MNLLAYKYRIYPTDKQKEYFAKCFGSARFIYNKLLEESKNNYEDYKTEKKKLLEQGLSEEEIKKILKIKKINEITYYKNQEQYCWLKEVDSLALCNAKIHLETAFQNFFRRIKNKEKDISYPKFKSKYNKQSYTTNNVNNSIRIICKNNKKYIVIPKIKEVNIIQHREFDGKIKNITLTKTTANEYYVSVLVETNKDFILSTNNNQIGIDLGIKDLVITSNGIKYDNIKTLSKYEKQLKRQQRILSKRQKGSKRRELAKLKVARLHKKIKNVRTNYLHNTSKDIINNNQVIYLENLNIKGMQQNHKIAKAISDCSLYALTNMLEYKAKLYGREVIKVDRFYLSSQTCSICGYKNTEVKNLSIREWTCPICNTKHDRDINAAINILQEGQKIRDAMFRSGRGVSQVADYCEATSPLL